MTNKREVCFYSKNNYEKYLLFSIIFLIVYIPLRDLISLYFGGIFKIIPDIIVLVGVVWSLFLKRKINLGRTDIFYLLFLGFGFLNTVIINNLNIIRYLFQLRSIGLYFVLYLLLKDIYFDEIDLKRILFFIRLIIGLLFSFAIIEKIFNKDILFPLIWKDSIIYNDNFIRTYSLINNPNSYASFLLLLFIIMNFLEEKLFSFKNLLFSIIIITGIILSVSRSTLLFLILYLFYLLLRYYLKKPEIRLKFLKYVFIIIMSIVLVKLIDCSSIVYNKKRNIVPDTKIIDRLLEVQDDIIIENSTINGRIYKVKKGFEIFENNKLVGTGFGTFGSSTSLILGSPLEKQYQLSKNFYVDNEYIKILVETGIIGFLLFLLFSYSLLIEDVSNVIIVFCFYGIGLFYNVFEVQVVAFIFWLYRAISLSKIKQEK